VPNLSILVSAVLVLSCGHRIAEADDRYTNATTVGVSNKEQTHVNCAVTAVTANNCTTVPVSEVSANILIHL